MYPKKRKKKKEKYGWTRNIIMYGFAKHCKERSIVIFQTLQNLQAIRMYYKGLSAYSGAVIEIWNAIALLHGK